MVLWGILCLPQPLFIPWLFCWHRPGHLQQSIFTVPRSFLHCLDERSFGAWASRNYAEPKLGTQSRERVPGRVWSGMVLLSVLVDEPTDEGSYARDLDKGAAMENIWMVGGEKALPDDSCQFHVRYSTDIVWQGLEFSIQETNLRLGFIIVQMYS